MSAVSVPNVQLVRLNGTADLGVDFGQVDGNTFAPIIARTLTFNVSGFRGFNVSSTGLGTTTTTGSTSTGFVGLRV